MRIHPETRIGAGHYTVRDLNRQVDFYRDILGFHLLWCDGDTAALGTKTRELLRLTENPSAPAPGRTTGLYHTAFLVPTKWELAHLVNRVIETRTPVQGHSNHGTHLALYLPDPEGNGIELAWDFPKEQWPMKDGVIRFEDMPRRVSTSRRSCRSWIGSVAVERAERRDGRRPCPPARLAPRRNPGLLPGSFGLRHHDRGRAPRRVVLQRRRVPSPHRDERVAGRGHPGAAGRCPWPSLFYYRVAPRRRTGAIGGQAAAGGGAGSDERRRSTGPCRT